MNTPTLTPPSTLAVAGAVIRALVLKLEVARKTADQQSPQKEGA